MKILIKECKKIMDIRVLLVIAVFTVLFYHLFLEVTIYPAGGQTTNSPYDMPFYAELIESWGYFLLCVRQEYTTIHMLRAVMNCQIW